MTGSTITLSGDITTSNAANNNVDINGAVVISGAVDIDTDTAGTDGTIDFSSTIVGDANNATTDNLTIDSGGSTVTFNGTIGVAAPIAGFNVNQDGGNVALTIPQVGTASGSAGTSGVTLIGNANTSAVTLSADSYEFGGATTITSAGNITAGATNPDIDITGNATLTGNLVLSDGNFNLNSGGGNISVSGTITSAGIDETLTLTDGGASGSITLGGAATSGSVL